MSKKVINFPKERSKKVEKLNAIEAKKMAFSLSIVSVLVAAVLINERMNNSQTIYIVSDNKNVESFSDRAVASTLNQNDNQNIKYEHDLAKKLDKVPQIDERAPAAISHKVGTIDQLRYGPLAGKYSIVNRVFNSEAKIVEISYVESSSTEEHPIFLDLQAFLSEYKNLFFIPYESARLFSQDIAKPSYELLNSNGEKVGQADFSLDDEGRFRHLKFTSSQSQ